MTSTDLMNVSAFENQTPDAGFAALNPQTESLADGIGSSYGVVRYKGKVWSLQYKGNNYTFVRPDDGSAAAFLDVIVLRSAPQKSKSYYPAGSFEQGGDAGGRPTCASLDGITPDRDAAQPQAAACAICPRNEWKQIGQRKTRDCSDYKRLAVLLLPAQSKAILGEPLLEPVFLRIPPASLNDLATLGEAMGKKGFHYSTYITRIGFMPEKAYPQMTFRALQKLGPHESATVMPMREEQSAYRITGEGEIGNNRLRLVGGTAQAPVGAQVTHQAQSVAPVKQPEPVKQVGLVAQEDPALAAARKLIADAERKAAEIVRAAAAVAEETVNTGFDVPGQTVMAPVAAVKPAAAPVVGLGAELEVVEAGFGDLGSTPASVAGPTPAPTNTVADTGPAEESDADLDARVLAMLTK